MEEPVFFGQIYGHFWMLIMFSGLLKPRKGSKMTKNLSKNDHFLKFYQGLPETDDVIVAKFEVESSGRFEG